MKRCETIQTGLVPVFVYDDVPWLPYPAIFEQIAFVVPFEAFPKFLDNFTNVPDEELERREQFARVYAISHFGYSGTLDQLAKFMLNEPNDIVVVRVPPTTCNFCGLGRKL